MGKKSGKGSRQRARAQLKQRVRSNNITRLIDGDVATHAVSSGCYPGETEHRMANVIVERKRRHAGKPHHAQ